MGNGENTLGDLFIAATNFPGVKVHESGWSPTLASSARENSLRCAELGRGGHHDWDRRFKSLVKTKLGYVYAEINAESWKWQERNNPVELWTEAFKCWKQSPGHWGVASERHKLFGAGLEKSKKGIWYMTIVIADGGFTPEAATEPEYKIW